MVSACMYTASRFLFEFTPGILNTARRNLHLNKPCCAKKHWLLSLAVQHFAGHLLGLQGPANDSPLYPEVACKLWKDGGPLVWIETAYKAEQSQSQSCVQCTLGKAFWIKDLRLQHGSLVLPLLRHAYICAYK